MAPNLIVPAITADEARALTDRIRGTAAQLWELLLEAYEREAWRALGYANFREYAKNEFQFSQSRIYQLLDHGRVIRALHEASNFSTIVELNECAARQIKPHLENVTQAIRDRVSAGEPADAVVAHVVTSTTEQVTAGEHPIVAVNKTIEKTINTTRRRYAKSHRRADQSNRFFERAAKEAAGLTKTVSGTSINRLGIDVNAVDLSLVPIWTRELRAGARALDRLADRLDDIATRSRKVAS